MKKLKWRPLNWLEHTLILMHKILKKNAPKAIKDLFKSSDNEVYNLRSNNMLVLSKPRTNAMKQSFSHQAAKIGNTMPLHLKNTSMSITQSKCKLRETLQRDNCIILDNLSY